MATNLLTDEEVFGRPSGRLLSDDEVFGAAPAPAPGSGRSAADWARDVGVTALKGAVGLPQAFAGLLNLADTVNRGTAPASLREAMGDPTSRPGVGKALEDAGLRFEDAQKGLDELYSPAQQAANRKVAEADGFLPTVQAALENPSTIARAAVESIPQMLGGAAVGRAVVAGAPKVAPWLAGAIGEGAIGAGSAAEQIRGETKDGELTLGQALAALGSGATTAALGAAGGRVAQKLGLGDVDTMLVAGPTKLKASPLGFAKQVIGSGISEGVFEELPQSITEQMWQNYATGKPVMEGVGNAAAMGLLTGAAMGAAGGGYNAAAGMRGAAAPAPAAPGTPGTPAGTPGTPGTPGTEPIPATEVLGGETETAPRGRPAEPTDAEKALLKPRQLTDLDRVQAIDAELSSAEGKPEVAAALQAERAQLTRNWPQLERGAPAPFTTEAGAKVDSRYALVDIDKLVTSHDEDLKANAAYPQELQPRQRDRAASEMQVQAITQKLDPARLGQSADAATGAPIVGADGLVESGNARTIAMKRVYQADGLTADEYRGWLRANAAQFGLQPEQVDALAKPMLVRVRTTPVDRAEFARQANAPTVAAMSPVEQARSDAARIDVMDDLQPDENGDFATSRDFIRRFVGRLPMTEQAGMLDAGGRLSSAGYSRVRNAVLAKAYGNSPVLTRMVESMNDDMRNVSRALMIAAPRVAQARGAIAEGRRFDADITPHLVAAAEQLASLKERGTSVDDALAQSGLLGEEFTPETRELMRFIAENTRRPRRMAEFITAYFDALDAAGDPAQGSLLGEVEAPRTSALMQAARAAVEGPTNGQAAPEDASRRQPGADRQGAAVQPADAPGNRRGDQGAGAPAAEVDWVDFPEATGTLGIPRAEMPQIPGKDRGALVAFLEARGIPYERTEVAPDSLRPTQREFSRKKTQQARQDTGGAKTVIVSGDGYVLDGHHRWMAQLVDDKPVDVMRFDAPIRELLAAVREFPGTKSAAPPSTPARDAKAQALADFQDALADLAALASRYTRAALIPEDDVRLAPTLRKLAGAAIQMVGTDLRRIVQWVRDAMRRDPTMKPYASKVTPQQIRKAAEEALGEAGNNAPQRGLFDEPELKQLDLFSAAPTSKPSPPDNMPELILGADAPPKDKPIVLVFGGSFNPTHRGHVDAAVAARKMLTDAGYKVPTVLVSPSPQRLMKAKAGTEASSLGDRTAMAKRAFAGIDGFEVSDQPSREADRIEGKLKRTQQADWAAGKYAGATIVSLTGQDAAPGSPPGFPSVYQGDAGTSHAGYFYLAVPREEASDPRSSSAVRKLVAAGQQVPSELADEEVVRYFMALKGRSNEVAIDGQLYDLDAANFDQPPVPRTIPDGSPLLQSTDTLETTPDGRPREQLRKAIEDRHFAVATPVTGRKPIAYVMGGGGASGKGTILNDLRKQGLIQAADAVHIDPDDIKASIPEWDLIVAAGDSRAAAITHEESSLIAKRVQKRAMEGGYDLVLDVTLGHVPKGRQTLKALKEAGYEVRLFGVTIDPAVALVRMFGRARATGRFVPPQMMLEAHQGFTPAFAEYADLVDEARLYDNTDGRVNLAEKVGGGLTVNDQAAYNEAVARSGQINENATTLRGVKGGATPVRPGERPVRGSAPEAQAAGGRGVDAGADQGAEDPRGGQGRAAEAGQPAGRDLGETAPRLDDAPRTEGPASVAEPTGSGQGDLFADQQFERQLDLFLDSEPDPSQAGPRTQAVRGAAAQALRVLRRTGTLLGRALSGGLAENQRATLVGQVAETPEDLAALAQVYRDPRFETFRVLFTGPGGKVVSQLGLTSRLPGSTVAILGEDHRTYFTKLGLAAKLSGATGFYMLHNHPSGLATPSSADEQITTMYAGFLSRTGPKLDFKGHVVIDTNQFSVIDGSGKWSLKYKDFGALEPYANGGDYGGVQITSPAAAAEFSKRLQVDGDAVTLIMLTTRLRISGVTSLPAAVFRPPGQMSAGERKAFLRRAKAQMRRAMLEGMGGRVIAVSRDRAALDIISASRSVDDSIHVADDGTTTSLANQGAPSGSVYPAERRPRVTAATSPDFEYLRRDAFSDPATKRAMAMGRKVAEPGRQTDTPEFKRWFGDSKVVDAQGRPLVVYHGTGSDVGAFSSAAPTATDKGGWGRGFYFAADPGYAAVYARKGAAPNVMPVYVSLRNPIVVAADGEWGARANAIKALGLDVPRGDPRAEWAAEFTEAAQAKGHDGVIYTIGGKPAEVVAFRPEQIKSAVGNNGQFDPADPSIVREDAATFGTGAAPAEQPKTAAQRADEIIAKVSRTPAPIDATARLLTRVTGINRLAAFAYDRGGRLLDWITPEKVKAGITSDYGVPEAVIDERAAMQGRQRRQLREAGALVEKLSTLTRAESRVAYEWMNMDGSDPRAYLSMMQGLPEESVKVLQEVQQLIESLSKEAVRLGQLEPEAYERHRMAYLRRSYAKHTAELTGAEKARRGRAISILGDQYRGRGMVQAVAMDRIKQVAPEWWQRKFQDGKADTGLKGQKFERLERRAASGERTAALPGIDGRKPQGKVLEVHWWPAGQKRPAQYADWDSAGTWEVRDTKGGNLVMWRDFTPEERERMGEIDEARFAIARTLHGMIHDVEVGRYLEWLAQKHAKADGDAIDGELVDASESMRDVFAPGTWVKVPESKIPGTSVSKYGKLAGQYLPGPIWNDLRQTVNGRFKPFGEVYDQVLRAWKISKTALSPGVHTNNVMSNMVMADWHGVTAGHVVKALGLVMAASDRKGLSSLGARDREAAREVLTRYEDAGGAIGGWVTQEIRDEQMAPIIEALRRELQKTDQGQAQIGVYAAMQHLLHKRFPEAVEALRGSSAGTKTAAAAKVLMDLYQAEDDVFRLAAWLKAKEQGATDLEAGKVARRSFLDYSINAPWISAMRSTAFPFIAFTYRAVPMLLETAGKHPEKLLKLMALAGGLNALGVMLGGGGDDEERKLLPEEKAGRIWGMVPKLIRMPWNDAHGSPVYLDIRRWIPVGDVVDVSAGHAAVPLLPAMYPGGPLVVFGELVANKSMFTGKPIVLETDTAGEKARKVVDYLWKAFSPNLVGVPGTYATQGVADSITGRTDKFGREMSTAQALASSVGVKLGSYPADVLRNNLMAKQRAEVAEIDRVMADLKRRRQTNRIDADDFQEQMLAQRQKKQKLRTELAEKMN